MKWFLLAVARWWFDGFLSWLLDGLRVVCWWFIFLVVSFPGGFNAGLAFSSEHPVVTETHVHK